jgi:hypothetical protein
VNEWQIIESDNFPDPPPEEAAVSGWRSRGWGLVTAGLFLVLLAAGFWLLRDWHNERQTVLREDLSQVVFQEETHRLLGQPDEALTDPQAPLTWQRAYRRTFDRANHWPPPSDVHLTAVDYFDGQCAVVAITGPAETLHPDPVRAYCLAEAGWRRAPIPPAAWGEEQAAINVINGVWLRFRARDRAFAELLADDLVVFLNRLAQLSLLLPTSSGLEIVIEPHDLHGALLEADSRRILLNSPELVSNQFLSSARTLKTAELSPVLSGEDAVRLALAQALLRWVGAFQIEPTPTLPGADRFAAALQTAAAVHLLLSPEGQAALLNDWRAQLDGQWLSPFFGGLLSKATPDSVSQAEVAALVTADYLYHRYGSEIVFRLSPDLARATSWDQLFQPLFVANAGSTQAALKPFETATEARASLLLEIETAQHAQANAAAIAALNRQYAAPTPSLPFMAALLHIDALSRGQRFSVSLPGRIEPLLVELGPEVTIETPGGLALSPGCLGLDARLTIMGQWLEQPRRIEAHQVTVRHTPLLTVPPAPAGTVAYLLVGRSPDEEPLPAYLESPSDQPPGQFLAALQADGSLQRLFNLSPSVRLYPLPVAAGQPAHFLFQLDLPNCEQFWFARYEQEAGLTEQWFAPPPLMQWVWRADQAAPLFLKRSPDRQGYQIFEADRVTTFSRPGLSDTPFWFMGWQHASRRLVSVSFRLGTASLGLLDLETGQLTQVVRPPYHALQLHGLSPDGNWLAYPPGLPRRAVPPSQLDLLNLGDATTTDLLQLDAGEELRSFTWSLYLSKPTLAILTRLPAENDLTRLLIVQLDKPGSYTELTRGEWLGTPIFCADGSLLYLAEQNGQRQLRRQAPGGQPQTLLSLNQPFRPVACS